MAQKRNRRHGVEDRWVKADGSPSANHATGKRWRARYVDSDGHERAKGFRTKAEATQWLNSVVAAQETGSYIDPRRGKVTFNSYYAEWSKRQIWESGTVKGMNLAAGSVTFGDVAFADLKPSHIEGWVKWMKDKPLAASTIKTRFNNVRSVIRAAVDDRFLARDVCARVSLPRTQPASEKMSIPTPEEVGKLLAAAEPRFSTFIALCAFAGTRLGEAAALKVGDVKFLAKEIRIERQVQRADGGTVEIRMPKYGSVRTVYVPDELLNMLSEHIRVHLPDRDPDRWMFPGQGDNPLHQNSVGYQWRKTRKAVGIDHDLHDLRHFYASGLIHENCDVVTVQRALGHKSPTVTLNTYAHLWPNANERTRKAAANLFQSAITPAADGLRTEAE
ncbi:tyrosine-type recombinase/integrase [Mycobacterium intracellulare]|uniref:tyrosine-type recombinase/integrase n=1 Tax=Mycobacterium intracellulare TaxID=1767 RepID=UPI0034D3317E